MTTKLNESAVSDISQPDSTDVLTLKQAAALLKLPYSSLRRYLKCGVLPGKQIGRHWRMSRAQLLAQLTTDGEPGKGRRGG